MRKLPAEADRVARLAALLTRTDPGPGGFYDDLGDPARHPHLVRKCGWEADPGFYLGSMSGIGFRGNGPNPAYPRAWWNHASTTYGRPLAMRYPRVEPSGAYRVRVVYTPEREPARKIRLVANGRHEVHGYLARPFEPVEFDVPAAATARGELTLEWAEEPGVAGHGRGCQVAEVWLIKNTAKE